MVEVAGKRFSLFDNPGDSEVRIAPPNDASKKSLHDSDGSVTHMVPMQISLKPQELVVLVSSPDDQDHQKGWMNFQEMLGQLRTIR